MRQETTSIKSADRQIAVFRDILRQMDDLEMHFDNVRHIRDVVRALRVRVEKADTPLSTK